jgi:hypothetical protein
MKKQRTQVIALVFLLIFWALLWKIVIRVSPRPPPAAKPAAAKVALNESPLIMRFHRLRAEMDALYHYRIKPTPFDARWDPFRIPGVANPAQANGRVSKTAPTDASQLGVPPPDFAESLLRSAIAAVRIGGVMTMNGTVQLTVDSQLHREGDVFTARAQISKTEVKLIRIRIRQLSESAVTFALEDTEGGGAELRIRLK